MTVIAISDLSLRVMFQCSFTHLRQPLLFRRTGCHRRGRTMDNVAEREEEIEAVSDDYKKEARV